MSDHIRALEILSALDDDHGVPLEGYERDALKWAIDQLRWRRVEDELPTEDGIYQVASKVRETVYPDVAQWCFGDKWDGIPWHETFIKWWRPIELPETP